jgi:hypothetical protein
VKQISEAIKSGGLTGQGFGNLLGRPRLAVLPLVLREAVQNSWDARRRTSARGLRFGVTSRLMRASEQKEFRKVFDQSKSLEPLLKNTLAEKLRPAKDIRVLELADFGTVGLSGTTRPDLPSGGVESRFVNFFFDVGRSHEESGDGGTYGFGRSSLYMAGRASLIVVDSLVETKSGTERRLMACRIGESFEVISGWHKGRYSGRHFWGGEHKGIAKPLVGSAAEAVAERLGMPSRSGPGDVGTTILIPWPLDEFSDGEKIARILLYHLWPKMVPNEGHPTIEFSVKVDGRSFAVSDPSKTEGYRLFVQALRKARARKDGPGAHVITTLRPRYTTGCLGVVEGVLPTAAANMPVETEDEDSDETLAPPLNRIVLMRPSELVVRYLPVAGTERAGKGWAGAFICDNNDWVRNSFARAEPPAHDDWIANRLLNTHQKYIVRKTVQSLLPEAVRSALGLGQPGFASEPANGASLASASARFSSMFLVGEGQGPAAVIVGPHNPAPLGVRGGLGNRVRVSGPEPLGLEMAKGMRIAKFQVWLLGKKGATAILRLKPSIYGDGGLDSPPEGLVEPSIVKWPGVLIDPERYEVTLSEVRNRFEIHVAMRDDYAVTLACVVEDSSE